MTRDLLSTHQAPWIVVDFVTADEEKLLPEALYASLSKTPIIRKLRGSKMRTRQGLMDEFGAALQFFDEFGENWYALRECLQYLDEWLPGDCYLLVVTDPEQVLAEASEELRWLLLTLNEVGEWWARPVTDQGRFDRSAIPFHTVLQVPESRRASLPSWLTALPVLDRS